MFQAVVRSQATSAVEITPDDNNDLAQLGAALWIGTGGNLDVELVGGGRVVFKNIQDGTFFPALVKRVYASATTCLDIIAVY